MIHDAQVFLSGYVATDPIFKRLNGRTSTARLRVAYTSRRMNRETGEWSDGPTSFVTVQCWRTLAENVAVCLRKGEPVLVKGRLQVREFESKNGGSRLAVEIDANSIGYDLTRGVAHFSRTHRAAGGTAAENDASPDASAQDADGAADGQPQQGVGESPDGPQGTVPPPEILPGANVLNERAVTQFARKLSESFGEDPESTDPAEPDRQLSTQS
jgi:single-strand DNA-binding protein